MLIASLILMQLIIVFGLIFIFRRVITQNVVHATQHLEKMDEEYSRKEKEIDQRLEDVKSRSQELLDKAREAAESEKAKILESAKKEKDAILDEARAQSKEIIDQADKARHLLISEIEERIKKEAVGKACKLVEDTLPEQFKQEIQAKWVEDLLEKGFADMDKLQLPSQIKDIKVSSAVKLNEKHRQVILKKIKDAVGYDINLTEEVKPEIIAGLIISAGNLIMDGSLRGKIRERAKNV